MKKNSTVRWREKGKIMANSFIKKQIEDILDIKDIDKKGESE